MKLFLLLVLLPLTSFSKNFLPNTFSANYEETIKSVMGKEKKSFGKIDYKYPGNIRLEVTSPDPSTFVANPKTSWYYVPPFVPGEQGQVTIQKSNKLPLTKFLDSIKNGIEGSKLFTHKYQGKELVLSFTKETQKEMNLKEVTLVATKDAKEAASLNAFEKLVLVYGDGRKVNLRFIDLKQDASFPPNHFTFNVPPKTRVTNN